MDTFPDWTQALLQKTGTSQVSHGLNLALKLQSPIRLPLMLWDIVVAQPKIRRAFQELDFLHFARFVPSWDGTAMMVTTEFDGPLEPYVMDFVLTLGEVFDTLLGYVDNHPPLSVREHPDEFWKYVLEWNRVPFLPRSVFNDKGLLPLGFDYPVYSAYPDKTVTDIVGKRTALLPPAIDHPADPVDLADVQGNILSGYKASEALHLFFTIEDGAMARLWLSSVLHAAGEAWNRPRGGLVSAKRWRTRADGRLDKPDWMVNVGFTYNGLRKLLPGRAADLERFPTAFREGSQHRHEANGDVGPSHPSQWRFGRDEQGIDVVLSVYIAPPAATEGAIAAATRKARIVNAQGALSESAAKHRLRLVTTQSAHTLPDGAEHFGFRDGISKPRISGQCKPDDRDFQPAASPGEFLLGQHYRSIFGGWSIGDMPVDLAQNGTFGALRLLEQHVDVFEATVKEQAAKLGMTEDLLKAKLLGRWKGGDPLSLDTGAPASGPVNDFDYAPSWEHPGVDDDHEGQRCPVGAHIRRCNPRTARVAGMRHSRRLIRRGMPSAWKDDDGTETVGLLGLFIGASLERQFEFIQRQWIQDGLAASGIRHQQDPIAGLRSEPTPFSIPGVGVAELPPLVTTRGSLYLFFPGLSMLRGLDAATVAAPARFFTQQRSRYDLPGLAMPHVVPDLRAQLAELRGLQGWVEAMLKDLLERNLNSKLTQMIVEQFLPPAPRSTPRAAAAGDLDPLDPAFIRDPYCVYAALRASGKSVVWVKEHRAHWVLTRNDARELFDDPKRFQQKPPSDLLRGIITMDPPRHAVLNAAVKAAFGASNKDTSKWTKAAIAVSLERLENLEQFDFMVEYGALVPRVVFWQVFGLPQLGLSARDIAAFDELAQTVMRHFSQPEGRGINDGIAAADASLRLAAWLGVLLGKALPSSLDPRSPYAGTLIGEIAARTFIGFPIAKRTLDFQESLMSLVQLALVHMSAQFLLGTATRNLLMPDPRDPAAPRPWRLLADMHAADPAAFDAALQVALEEARRVDPPAAIVQRYAVAETTVGGVTIGKDDPVHAVVSSINRDDGGALGDLERFHWNRAAPPPHFSLGRGIHQCLGTALQSELVTAALSAMIPVMPGLRLCDELAIPAWLDNIYFRALQSLPVTRCPLAAPAGPAGMPTA